MSGVVICLDMSTGDSPGCFAARSWCSSPLIPPVPIPIDMSIYPITESNPESIDPIPRRYIVPSPYHPPSPSPPPPPRSPFVQPAIIKPPPHCQSSLNLLEPLNPYSVRDIPRRTVYLNPQYPAPGFRMKREQDRRGRGRVGGRRDELNGLPA